MESGSRVPSTSLSEQARDRQMSSEFAMPCAVLLLSGRQKHRAVLWSLGASDREAKPHPGSHLQGLHGPKWSQNSSGVNLDSTMQEVPGVWWANKYGF